MRVIKFKQSDNKACNHLFWEWILNQGDKQESPNQQLYE